MDQGALDLDTADDEVARGHARLAAAVRELESAHAEGRLGALLPEREGVLPPQLVEAYQRLLTPEPISHDPLRAPAVERLLAKLARDLLRVEVRIPARVAPRDTHARPPVLGIVAKTARSEVWMRPDQAASARAWGIAFDIEDERERAWLERYLLTRAALSLGASLAGLVKIRRRLGERVLEGPVAYVPPEDAEDFEQLVVDVLNEHALVARHAPLHEDFFEKTDLRLALPELQRRRGARVQVTRSVTSAAHAAKIESIRRVEEVVIVSPLSLARAIRDGRAREWLGDHALARLQPLLAGHRASEVDDARALLRLLTAAIERRHAGPRGPLVAVPEPLRLLIQSYAAAEARRTTAAMRERQARRPAEPPSLGGGERSGGGTTIDS